MARCLFSILLILLSSSVLLPQGKVYIIIGSDTAIWESMTTNKFECTYNIRVIPDALRNYYRVMQPGFRSLFSDSYNGKLKLTWWLMGGNIFRYATNKDVPYPNTMVPYLSKKYYGDAMQQFGDELSVHYHSFVWTDYDNDGVHYWNQAKHLSEFRDDFDYTLAQYLIEEDIFPVSFRAGWNFMDTEWQNYIDTLFPFSMHNQYPAVRKDTVEPLDNIYDWSKSSPLFVPFHPSSTNYQLPGDLNGYELRSVSLASMSQSTMNTIFNNAKNGADQVVCLWAHVWDDAFPEKLQRLDTLANRSAASYPTVKFKYTTAIEGMQNWLKTTDLTPPAVTITPVPEGGNVAYTFSVNEPLFQPFPFVGAKTLNEDYFKMELIQTGTLSWRSKKSYPKDLLAVIGVAAIDPSGNLGTEFLDFRGREIFIDNGEPGYSELHGMLQTTSAAAWGLDSRVMNMGANDSAAVAYRFTPDVSGPQNIFLQVPGSANMAKVTIQLLNSSGTVLTTVQPDSIPGKDWFYLITADLSSDTLYTLKISGKGAEVGTRQFQADVVKISPLVREFDFEFPGGSLILNAVPEQDTFYYSVKLRNRGSLAVSVVGLSSQSGHVSAGGALPFTVLPFTTKNLPIRLFYPAQGMVEDTLELAIDNCGHSPVRIPMSVLVKPYFTIIDNDDAIGYVESGNWAKSVVQAWGASSRYAGLNQQPGAKARFFRTIAKPGNFLIDFVVPVTENAATSAKYTVKKGSDVLHEVVLNQNLNSGSWVPLGVFGFQAGDQVEITVADEGNSGGAVLRADAVRISLTDQPLNMDENDLPTEYSLSDNYPNPFNPSTTIDFAVPETAPVSITVYDLLGREVATLLREVKNPGRYRITFDAAGIASGIYFYRIQAGRFTDTKKMMLIR